MFISSRTPEGTPHRCPVCGASVQIEPSKPIGDAPCPKCGTLLWFNGVSRPTIQGIDANSLLSAAPNRPRLALGLFKMIVSAVVPAVIMAVCLGWLGWTGHHGLGPIEMFVILFLGLLLFGRKLPQFGRDIGRRIVG